MMDILIYKIINLWNYVKPLRYLPVSFQQILEHLKVADLNPSHVVSRRQITITNTPQTPAEPRTLI